MVRRTNMKTGPEISKQLRGETLGHDIGKLMRRGQMKDTNLPKRNLLPNKVDVNLDVFGPFVLYWIGRHVDGADVVTIDNSGGGEWGVKLLKELPQPTTLHNGVGDSSVFGFCTGARDGGLPLGGP